MERQRQRHSDRDRGRERKEGRKGKGNYFTISNCDFITFIFVACNQERKPVVFVLTRQKLGWSRLTFPVGFFALSSERLMSW